MMVSIQDTYQMDLMKHWPWWYFPRLPICVWPLRFWMSGNCNYEIWENLTVIDFETRTHSWASFISEMPIILRLWAMSWKRNFSGLSFETYQLPVRVFDQVKWCSYWPDNFSRVIQQEGSRELCHVRYNDESPPFSYGAKFPWRRFKCC